MIRRALLAAALAVLAAGCGGGGGDEPRADRTPAARTPSPTPAAPPSASAGPAAGQRAIVDRWARTLARSDEEGAARLFALPALVSQGPPARLKTRAAVRFFNATLPCGARLLSTRREQGYLIGTFRLKHRPGHRCDSPGAKAAVAFAFRGDRISEWRRVPVPGEGDAPPAETESA